MFLIGDIIFYPVFGAGYILNIEDRIIHGEIKKYYIIKFINGMDAMIPVYSKEARKIRRAVNDHEYRRVLSILCEKGKPLPSKWNLRNRYYNESIKGGDIYKLAEILSSIYDVKEKKELSKSEQNISQVIIDLIAGEIALSLSEDMDKVKEEIIQVLDAKSRKY